MHLHCTLHRFKECWDPLKKHPVEGKGEVVLVQWLPLEPPSLGGASEGGGSDSAENPALGFFQQIIERPLTILLGFLGSTRVRQM